MQVFWCKECKVPILYAGKKDKEKAEDNPYLDIGDEVLEWITENEANKNSYRKFSFLKEKIDKKLDNNKLAKEIKAELEKEYKDYPLEAREYAVRYLDIKTAENNEKKLKNIHCPNCNSKAHYMSKDIRPVFMEERIMLSVLLGIDMTNKNIWNGSGNRYIIDGQSSDIVIRDLYEVDDLNKKREEIRKRIKDNKKEIDFSKFIEVNQEHFKHIDKNAIEFISKAVKIFKQRMKVVSFSGGKDSTVISDIVTRALSSQDILHVFGDTTLEFPFTYDYIEMIKERPKRPPFLPVDTPGQSFDQLAKKFGPPSRVISWCCSIFKTGPIGNLFREIADQQEILTFYGVRRSESNSRSKYNKISKSPKISKQLVVSPIIDWHDADVWLYLLTRGIDFNKAYRFGFTRVGCWCCPNNSGWSEFLCKIFMPDKAEEWRNFLVDFAKKIGKPDAEVYIDTGKWKARQGGQGLATEKNYLEAKPCALEDDAKNYDLKRPIDDSLYQFFKPFGIVDKDIGDEILGEVYILNPKNEQPMMKLKGNKGSKQLKVSINSNNLAKGFSAYQLFQRVACQLRKYQSCISCSACANVCSYDAISLTKGYKIDEDKCVHCAKCIAYFHKGCLVTRTMVDY